jgi:phosphatidylglycerophosphate synthase
MLSISLFLELGGKIGALLAGILLSIAWATDGLDGFTACRLVQTTLDGSLFNLISDRLLMITRVIASVAEGFWSSKVILMPFNPYPFLVMVIAGILQ